MTSIRAGRRLSATRLRNGQPSFSGAVYAWMFVGLGLTAILNGVTLSVLTLAYSSSSIATTFVVTSGMLS